MLKNEVESVELQANSGNNNAQLVYYNEALRVSVRAASLLLAPARVRNGREARCCEKRARFAAKRTEDPVACIQKGAPPKPMEVRAT